MRAFRALLFGLSCIAAAPAFADLAIPLEAADTFVLSLGVTALLAVTILAAIYRVFLSLRHDDLPTELGPPAERGSTYAGIQRRMSERRRGLDRRGGQIRQPLPN